MKNSRGADRKDSSRLVFTEFVPPSGWTEDSTCHYLLVDLPGFKKEEVKLQVDNYNQIIVNGERQISANKYNWFEQKFQVPDNSEIKNITGKFEGEVLYVTVPKEKIDKDSEKMENGVGNIERENVHSREAPNEDESLGKKDNDKHGDVGNGDDHDQNEKKIPKKMEEGEGEGGLLESIKEKLNKSKGTLLIVVLAFSLGVLVSHKFQSNEQ